MTEPRRRAHNSTLPVRSEYMSRGTGLAPGKPWKTPVPVLSAGMAGTRETGKSAATKTARIASGRAESFPPKVAALIDARDLWCVHCGSPNDLHRHHRRIKGIGGDPREHTDCACVGVRLCWLCHSWVHSGNGAHEARAEGLIIPRATLEPWTLAVLVHLEEDRAGLRLWPSCDGLWLDYVPEGAVALCPG